MMLPISEIIIRLVVAAVLGSLVGLERERKEWVAGLRTHMLVCVGSTLAMIVSAFGFQDIVGTHGVELDPSRIAAQVISGIGFLGAGTILFLRQEVVRGLTTAAGLWSVAAVGLAVGGGLYIPAFATTLIILFILAGIKWIEKTWFSNYTTNALTITLDKNAGDCLTAISTVLKDNDIKIVRISIFPGNTNDPDLLKIVISKSADKMNVMKAIGHIRQIPGVNEVQF